MRRTRRCDGLVRAMNLATLLTDSARRDPHAEALRRGGRRIAYAELDRAAARVAERLADAGVRPGDRVALMLPNVPELVAAYYGVLRAGAIAVPLDVDLERDELRHALTDSGAGVLIAWRGLSRADGVPTWHVAPGSFFDDGPPAGDPVERAAGDTAVLVYTSGTTGRPKGAELTHANLAGNARVTARLFGLQAGDAVLAALPLAHAFGQTCTLNATLLAGATAVLVPRFDAAEVRSLLPGLTVLVGVPSMYAALIAEPLDPGALRICISGGAPLAPELLDACEAALGVRVLEGYGLTETSPVASFNRPDGLRRPGSIGTPVDGVEMKLVDGEIAIRGHNVMKGYWGDPEATRAAIDADGWFFTGDLGRVDEDGRFYIVDRKKDLIIRDGRNVYPREIEDVLQGHPDVREAAVIGIPHALLGEEVAACVVLAPGSRVTESDLRDYVRERVAESKYPRLVWLAPELPRSATGKLLKRAIVLPGGVSAAA
jgi:long-chain acyl-CoA synthetase